VKPHSSKVSPRELINSFAKLSEPSSRMISEAHRNHLKENRDWRKCNSPEFIETKRYNATFLTATPGLNNNK
jgi:hypothetical protein